MLNTCDTMKIESVRVVIDAGASIMEVDGFIRALLRQGGISEVTIGQDRQNKFNPLPLISASAVGIGGERKTAWIAGATAEKLIRMARTSPEGAIRSLEFRIRRA